jgi:Mn-containing catalase
VDGVGKMAKLGRRQRHQIRMWPREKYHQKKYYYSLQGLDGFQMAEPSNKKRKQSQNDTEASTKKSKKDKHEKDSKTKGKARETGEFHVVKTSLVLSIPPIFASNPRAGAEEMLDSMVMR